MTLPCTINGQPATIEIPDEALTRGALTRREAAKYLGIGLTKLDILIAAGEIEKTIYCRIPVASLQAHLQREIERSAK